MIGSERDGRQALPGAGRSLHLLEDRVGGATKESWVWGTEWTSTSQSSRDDWHPDPAGLRKVGGSALGRPHFFIRAQEAFQPSQELGQFHFEGEVQISGRPSIQLEEEE